jgi:hypothetical protein
MENSPPGGTIRRGDKTHVQAGKAKSNLEYGVKAD